MADLEKLTLTLNPSSDNLQYEMYPVTEVDERQDKPAFSIAPPGQDARNNILLRISGMQGDITLEFAIYDDGSDRANGTYTSTVVTVGEQINYLRDEIQKPTFSAGWTLDHTTGGQFDTKIYDNDDVYVENMDLPTISRTERKWKIARLSLRRGGSA